MVTIIRIQLRLAEQVASALYRLYLLAYMITKLSLRECSPV